MPLRYSTPGAYVETFDADPQRIRPKRTDVAGFVGVAARGPLNAPVKIQTWRQFQSTFGGRIAGAYLGFAVYGFFLNGGRTCWVVRAGDASRATTASATLDVAGVGRLALAASSPGAWGNGLTVAAEWDRDAIVALRVASDDGRAQRIALDDPTLPIDRAGAPVAAARAWQTNLLGVDDAALQELDDWPLVVALAPASGVRVARLDTTHRQAAFAGGSDGGAPVALADLIGRDDPEAPTGLAALEHVKGVSIAAVPDLMLGQDPLFPRAGGGFDVATAHEAVMASCLRCGDRVALLDLPLGTRPAAAAAYPDSLQRTSVGALYYPWLLVDDPLKTWGNVRAVPPSGHVAGMFARVDRRRGVHKPPANETLEGAFDTSIGLDDPTHGTLNDAGVNAIRTVAGRGVLVMGARTLDRDVKWRYVNVRRLFLMIEQAVADELQSLVFEPNDPGLWREVRRGVEGFLEGLWRAGMLDGATSADAYTVRCDESTNPPWETDQGRVTCVVGIQPPYPAEFVIVRIGVSRDGVEVRSDEVRDA